MSKNSKRSGGKAADEAVAGATERVLKQICELYEGGLAGAPTGAMGLKAIAESPLLGMKMRKARKKINVMIVGNHSAGKSSFINWYVPENWATSSIQVEGL